ncbi:MAG: Oxidoreductase [Vezdaea aestivalis]|nr:MAG: Oxidoreductase [Vezdaea aestivalis]
MLNSSPRALLRKRIPLRAIRPSPTASSRRFLSTAPPSQRSRSWKNSAIRWGIAGAIIYYYNTSSYFKDEPEVAAYFVSPLIASIEDTAASVSPTIDSLVAKKRRLAPPSEPESLSPAGSEDKEPTTSKSETQPEAGASIKPPHEDEPSTAPLIEGSEEEEGDSQQGAFNPETGEINWDCPCLGGMAHGTCGEHFKEAFSCFVYSTEEPKGMDCIEKFKNMQDCFREHPDEYPVDDEEDDEEEVDTPESNGEEPLPPPKTETLPITKDEKIKDAK